MKNRLEELAGEDANRLAVLAGRKERSKNRRRFTVCRTCNENTLNNLDSHDSCDGCLENMWVVQNIQAGVYEAGKVDGLRTVRIISVDHWLEYPHLSGDSYRRPAADAPFARHRGSTMGVDTASPTMQTLFVELFTSLAEALPVDPGSRNYDVPALIPNRDGDSSLEYNAFLRMPAKAVKAARDLWQFIKWHSAAAYEDGFTAGHDLLGQMNLGKLTHEGFLEAIARQTRNTRSTMDKAERQLVKDADGENPNS